MTKGEHIDPSKMFIGYEPITTGILDGRGQPIITGYRGTICVVVNNTTHKTVLRTPDNAPFDGPSLAMEYLGAELPVLGLRFDRSVWHLLPEQDRPSSLDPTVKDHSIFWFPYLEELQLKVAQERLSRIKDKKAAKLIQKAGRI